MRSSTTCSDNFVERVETQTFRLKFSTKTDGFSAEIESRIKSIIFDLKCKTTHVYARKNDFVHLMRKKLYIEKKIRYNYEDKD